MDPTHGKGPDPLKQGGSDASNDAAAPDPSKTAALDSSKTTVPDPGKTAVPAIKKAGIPTVNKASAPAKSKTAVPAVKKAVIPTVNKTSAPAVKKTAVPAPNKNPAVKKTAVPAVNRVFAPVKNKVAVPAINRVAVPAANKVVASNLSKVTASDSSKARAPDSNKAVAPDSNKNVASDSSKAVAPDSNTNVAPDSSKAVESAVADEPSKSVGDGPTKGGGKPSGAPFLKTSWSVYELVRLAYFLACNAALAIHGLYVFARGLVRFIDTRRKFSNPQMTTTETTNGIISIIVGSVAIVVAFFGLFCTLVKNRILSIANIVVLFLSILGFVIFIFLYVKDTADFVAEERASTREGMLSLYDISVIKESKQFTAAINRIQQKSKCCGWAGQDEENIYLKTPWFKTVNLNLSSQSQFLPSSCCSTTELDCRSFKDMKAAREKRLIYGRDCWHLIAEEFNREVNGVLIELIVGSAIQAFCIVPPVVSYTCIGIHLLRSKFALRDANTNK